MTRAGKPPLSALETVPHEGDDGLSLRVDGPSGARSFTLPKSGEVAVGRADECEIQVDDVKLSRRHFTLRIGAAVEVVDAGSRNGTRVRGAKLATGGSARVLPGEPFQAGLSRFMVIGSSAARPAGPSARTSLELESQVERFAKGDVPVLILGETGVGKERLARLLHARSPRSAGPIVTVHCGALSETLLESELFGHERGAFTGATVTKPGLLESANGGTVFLDEVGDTPSALQVKLLRVLEQREVTRVGAVAPVPLDVRFVAATNRELEEEVARGRFRSDLFYRLNGVTLRVPPLRDRAEEIPALAETLAKDARARLGWTAQGAPLSEDVLHALRAYAWPGNVRELRGVIERALLLSEGAPIAKEHLAIGGEAPSMTHAAPASKRAAAPPPVRSLKDTLRDEERRRIEDALEKCGGNQTRAAELLKMPRRTLVERLRAYAKDE